MKILYASPISPNDSCLYRAWALERLGHQVIQFNSLDYDPTNPILNKIAFRLSTGPSVARLNRDLIRIAETEKPDILWIDKVLAVRPSTLDRMRTLGITTVSYMIDNPFGTRRDPGWRLYMKTIPHYDLHVTQRDRNVLDYIAHGARDVIKIQTAYEPTLHFAPHEGWSDIDRNRDVSFIGTPYDDRAETLTRLWRDCGFSVNVSGNIRSWTRALKPEAFQAIFRGGELYNDDYRNAIWRSRINLSFLTHSNQDEFVQKQSSSPPSTSWPKRSAAISPTKPPEHASPKPETCAQLATATTTTAKSSSSSSAPSRSQTKRLTTSHSKQQPTSSRSSQSIFCHARSARSPDETALPQWAVRDVAAP
jgi:spore maturation protein CgeB